MQQQLVVNVESYDAANLDRAMVGECQRVLQLSFHKDPNRLGFYTPLPPHLLLAGAAREAKIDQLLATASERGERWHIVRADDGRVASLATTFSHVATMPDGSERTILALGEVATDPSYRGCGFASAAVRRAFAELGRWPPDVDVMLWQTGEAQGFYERLGARVVPTESIVNGAGPLSVADAQATDGPSSISVKKPRAFWDLVAMIYPSDAAWPEEGEVDLMAEGW